MDQSKPESSDHEDCDKQDTQEEELKNNSDTNEEPSETLNQVNSADAEEASETVENEDQKANNRHVSFGDIFLHVHLIILSPPPAIPIFGPPISIAWKPMMSRQLSIEEYEEMRGPPRPLNKLKIPSAVRAAWLKDIGYTQKQIAYVAFLAQHGGNDELADAPSAGRISEGGRRKPKPKPKPKKDSNNGSQGGGCLSGCFGKDPACN